MEKVRYFLGNGEDIEPDCGAVLKRMSEVPGVSRPVVALPDLHFKYSYHTPTGVVALSVDSIIPKFVNANCGMSFIKTPFRAYELDEEKTDRLFAYLRSRISISTRLHPAIGRGDFEKIVTEGALWSMERFGLDPGDLANFENRGSMFAAGDRSYDDIMRFIPRTCRDVGLLSMGVLGYGNHFIEMQSVDRLVNRELAEKLGVEEGQVCFMIHSDSRAFGQSLIDFYSKKAKRLMGLQQLYKKAHYAALASEKTPLFVKRGFDRLNFYLNRMKSTLYWKGDKLTRKRSRTFEAIDAATREAEAYLVSTYAAINFGYANRTYLAGVIQEGLREALGAPDARVRILHDGNHDALQKETIDGVEYYVHRNGANRALPPEYFPGHPVFSITGQPVLLPSSLGRPSYLCAATTGCPGSFYSACHGVGRRIDRGEAREKFRAGDVFDEASAAGMKIYDYGKGKVQEESPRAFKDVEEVLETVTRNGIAEPVAKLRPLAALKGWR